MIRWLRSIWYAQLRLIDMKVLWPSCRSAAPDLDQAKGAFAVHAFGDPAWLVLGDAEIVRIIDSLK